MKTKGVWYALGAYLSWGLFPLYWKPIHDVPAIEILSHRIAWSLLVVLGMLAWKRHWGWLPEAIRDRRVLGMFTLSALLLSVNWFVYIWAVNAGHVVESSLGYFINPLVSVLLGRLVLKETLRPAQRAAVGLAAAGVAWLTWRVGAVPWIALTLASTFGCYGLLRKTGKLGSLEGLALETMLMFPMAAGYLFWLEGQGVGHFAHSNALTNVMLAGAGVVTAIPLLLFASGARRLPLATLGVLQYLSPSIQFALGVFVFHEAFDAGKLAGFACIWGALVLYSAEGILYTRWQGVRAVEGA